MTAPLLSIAYAAETILVSHVAYLALARHRYVSAVWDLLNQRTEQLTRYIESTSEPYKTEMKDHAAWNGMRGLTADGYIPAHLQSAPFRRTAWMREAWGGWYGSMLYLFFKREHDVRVSVACACAGALILFVGTYFDLACANPPWGDSPFGCPSIGWLWSSTSSQPLVLVMTMAAIALLPLVFILLGRRTGTRAGQRLIDYQNAIMSVPLKDAKDAVTKVFDQLRT